MANRLFYKGKVLSDDTDKLFFAGYSIGRMWYKGQLVWDRIKNSDKSITFWEWAAPSKLGGGAFRSRDYYENVYLPGLPDKGEGQTAFPATNMEIDPSGWLSKAFEDSIPAEGVEYDRIERPMVNFAEGVSISDIRIDNGTIYYVLTRNEDIEKRWLYHQTNTFSFGFYSNVCQWRFPCGTIKGGAIVPAGSYTIRLGYTNSYRIGPSIGYDQGVQALYYDDKVAIGIPLGFHTPKKEFTLEKSGTVGVTVEIGIGVGEAGTRVSSAYTMVFSRSVPYYYSVRRGQLRGLLNTQKNGSGKSFDYVLNEKRIESEPYPENVPATVCLDPETLEYIEIDADGRHFIGEPYTVDDETYANCYGYTVIFNESDVHIYKNYRVLKKSSTGWTMVKSDLVSELFLYYIQGYEWYGGSETNG